MEMSSGGSFTNEHLVVESGGGGNGGVTFSIYLFVSIIPAQIRFLGDAEGG